ncbi:MAG: aminopeptidase, partial [Pseudomonadota bacterium]
VDISLDRIYRMRLDTRDPDIDYARTRDEAADKPAKVGVELNREGGQTPWVERNPDITDFYDQNDIYTVTNVERNLSAQFRATLEPWELTALDRAVEEDREYYVLEFSNVGGLVMPIILDVTLSTGATERMYIPAEIWRRNPHAVRKLLMFDRGVEITQVVVDPNWETADADIENNYYPRRLIPSRVEAFKAPPDPTNLPGRDIMQDSKAPLVDPVTGEPLPEEPPAPADVDKPSEDPDGGED